MLHDKTGRPGGFLDSIFVGGKTTRSRYFRRATHLMGALALALVPVSAEEEREQGFQSIFNGRSFRGWKAPDMTYWSIENGAIVGQITPSHRCDTNQYLVWQGGSLADFEIKLKSRLNGSGGINNGFQFRSRVLPDGDVAGYQMDNNLQTPWLVRLYDEFGRHTLAWRGKRGRLSATGELSSEDISEAGGPAWFRLEDWHEYHLVCIGPRLTLSVNGRLAAEVFDHDPRRADPQGVFALQLHSGPPTVVEFKDIRLKILGPAKREARLRKDRRREALLRRAVARWDLGTGGHQATNPLRYFGSLDDMELNVRGDGPGSRKDARVGLLRGGYFEAASIIEVPNSAATVYVRAKSPSGQWDGVMLAQSDGLDRFNFSLHGSGGEIRWEVQTQSGRESTSFRLTDSERTLWHDLVARFDQTKLDLFCDGQLVASRTLQSPPSLKKDVPTRIGAQGGKGGELRPFHGELEETAVWMEALDDQALSRLTEI